MKNLSSFLRKSWQELKEIYKRMSTLNKGVLILGLLLLVFLATFSYGRFTEYPEPPAQDLVAEKEEAKEGEMNRENLGVTRDTMREGSDDDRKGTEDVSTGEESEKEEVQEQEDTERKQEGAEAASDVFDLSQMGRPLAGTISKEYGFRYSETLDEWRQHRGIDIRASKGTPVRAALKGRVETVAKRDDLGLVVQIGHGKGCVTLYGNLGGVKVEKGQNVEKGEIVGLVGESSLFESQDPPHLHFGVIVEGQFRDPLEYLRHD